MQRRTLQVTTNSFEITALPRQPYLHFDEINPPSLTKNRNYEIINRLVTDNARTFNPRPIYDGRKNLFCKGEIKSETVCSILLYRTFRSDVSIKRVGMINPQDVMKLTRPRVRGDNAELNAMSLNLLQLIVRQAPNLRHRFPADARSFYVDTGSLSLENGLSAWRGFFQSVRPTMGRLIINIDVSHAMVYTPGDLIDTMLDALGFSPKGPLKHRRNVRELQDLDRAKLLRLRAFLKGVQVVVSLTPNMRPRPIADLVLQAGLQEFDKDGERLTIQRHFETKYNVPVRHPSIVGVRIGKTAVIPAEFCRIVPGQVYRKKVSPDAQKEFLGFATQRPEIRLAAIEKAVRDGDFDYATSDFMRDAGMNVGMRPIVINGELIPPPPIKYGGSQMNVPPNGAWNVVGKRFLRPGTLTNWGVVVYDQRANQQQVHNFIRTMVGNMRKLAVPLDQPPIQAGNMSNPEDVSAEMHKMRAHAIQGRALGEPQFILIFLPKDAAEVRRVVKHWGDCKRKIITQCVRATKWEKINDQYCNNVALKINARVGGTNSSIDVPQVNALLKETMVIGADVGHPGPGSNNRPSVTGLVATVDPDVSIITSAASVQRPRLEIIQDLQPMIAVSTNMTSDGYARNPLPPRNILFYRDGVSEGEYAQVVEQEIPLIKDAFKASGLPENIWPKLLFIVVGKSRHHVRFFPRRPEEGDRKSGNCPPGLLVDKEITNPHYEDFYLQSHGGLLGTSRPSHYIILLNETQLNKAQIQTVSFHLCHTYASATRSVSIPAPKICSRLEFHCEDGASLSDTASNVTGGTAEFDLDHWKRVFKVSRLAKANYFL
ncbi:Piwi domain-containing protein [Daedaleopsis nitida]|nr:Piwi domain-containing protein [Daedaleopsis nitida]